MPAQWGLYERKEYDKDGNQVGEATTVVLPAEDFDRERYEAKAGDGHHDYATFEYKGAAPAPGMEESVPDAVVAAAEVRRLEAAARRTDREFQARKDALEKAQTRNARAAARTAKAAE